MGLRTKEHHGTHKSPLGLGRQKRDLESSSAGFCCIGEWPCKSSMKNAYQAIMF